MNKEIGTKCGFWAGICFSFCGTGTSSLSEIKERIEDGGFEEGSGIDAFELPSVAEGAEGSARQGGRGGKRWRSRERGAEGSAKQGQGRGRGRERMTKKRNRR